ncbi:MAG: hypothetical protein ABR907_17600 [Terracidiphilus sp.]|jgi:hypothetical protein
MNRPILGCAFLLMATAALAAQQANPYEGTSNPPPDDTIVTSSGAQAKPPAGHRMTPAAAPEESQPAVEPAGQTAAEPAGQPATGQAVVDARDPDGDMIRVAPTTREPALTIRNHASDPDGDIVHPEAPRPGEVPEGATIRVELLDRLSTVSSERGDPFRSRVASDVFQGDQVLIPAGTEIDGRVAEVSSGHAGGRGSMRLRPETMILPDGTKYELRAELSGTPGARSKVGSEGEVLPASRIKRDSVEYGGSVGAGATTGAIVGGPVGALTGGLIGAGVVTAHLLVSHPQATLESGTVLIFTLSEPLQMTPASAHGN